MYIIQPIYNLFLSKGNPGMAISITATAHAQGNLGTQTIEARYTGTQPLYNGNKALHMQITIDLD